MITAILVALLVLQGPVRTAGAEEADDSTVSSSSVNQAILEAKLKEAESAAGLDEATRKAVTDLYRSALTFLEKAAASKAQTQAYIEARQSAPEKARRLREQFEQGRQNETDVTLTVTENTPLTQVEQEALKQKADQAAVEAKLNGLEKQLTHEAGRPSTIRQRLAENKQRQEDISLGLKIAAPPDEPPALTEAKRRALESEAIALSAELQELDQELLSQPMRTELLEAQHDLTASSLKRIRQRVKLLEAMLGSRRIIEAEQAQSQAEEARREARGEHPLVQELADRNAALSNELINLAAVLEKVTTEDDSADAEAERLAESLRNTRQKFELAGLSEALGQVLLEQRRDLPDPRSFRKKMHEREREIAEAGLRLIQYEEERRSLRNTSDYVDYLVAKLPQSEVLQIRGKLTELANNRLDLLVKAVAMLQSYLRALGELDYAYRNLLDKIEDYDEFLAERLLWVRSVPPPNLDMLHAIPEQLAELLAPANWYEVLRTAIDRLTRSWFYLPVILVVGLLLVKSRKLAGAIRDCGKRTGKPSTDRFSYTIQALGLTLLLAAPWPLLLWITGVELGQALDVADFTRSVSKALLWVAPAYYYLQSFRTLCLPGGVAERHFRWDTHSLRLLRRQLVRLMLAFLPAVFVAIIVINQDSNFMGGGTGRLAIVFVLFSLALFSYRLFNPGTGVLQAYLSRNPGRLLARMRYLWLALSVATPLGLAVLAIVGYLYTAGVLTARLVDSLWLILVLVIIQQLVVRWLLVTRRRVAFQTIVERRRARAEEEQQEGGGLTVSPGGVTESVEEPAIDLMALSEDSRKLINMALSITGIFGIWFIWSEVLPAFGILREFTLWNISQLVNGQETQLPITLADAGLALLIIGVTLIAARRFPAVLEIILHQRLAMTAGGRYTATTLSRYVIVAVGILFAISLLGGRWEQIQWLVAALGVGIGFGLQEIVANFISGLIILFERPIRVGDMVTVGDTVGTVSRIQIRATTILTRDRQELLVPNKEFITGRLLNWSLSDQITRLVIPVGVAYGSDVALAMKLMGEVATNSEYIIDDPKPFVTFEGFGDNSLTLILRCFTDNIDNRMTAISRLHEEINRVFNQAGIVIAFPQRDLHLDTSRPLDIRLHSGKDTTSGPQAPSGPA